MTIDLRMIFLVGHKRKRRGGITVLAALFMVVLFAFAAFSIDLSYIALCKTQLQTTSDSAALAGVTGLANGPRAARDSVISTTATNRAGGYTISVRDQDIELGTWDAATASFTILTGNAESNANAVRVTCYLTSSRNTPINLFFAPVIGTSYANLTASSTSTQNKSRCGLIVGLTSVSMSASSYTDSFDSSVGSYLKHAAGNHGDVCSNGPISLRSAASINGDAHPGVGQVANLKKANSVTGKVQELTKAVTYKAPSAGTATTRNNNSKIGRTHKGANPLDAAGDFTLAGGDSIALAPGVYYFKNLDVSGGADLQIVGPTTIYATGNVSFSGGSCTNATALPKNLQLFPMGPTCDLSGSADLYAVVYGPACAINCKSSADLYGAVIGLNLTLSGHGGIHADQSLSYPYLTSGNPKSKLVQ